MIYVYEDCCGQARERVCSLASYEKDPSYKCPDCGKPLEQRLTPPRFFVKGFEPFKSPVDGSIIRTYHELAEHNKRNNVQNLHDGYDEKAILNFTKQDLTKTEEKERRKDLAKDMEKAVQKLEQGYKPSPAEYTEEFPNVNPTG